MKKLGGTYTFHFPVHNRAVEAVDADALPTAEVFEDDGDVAIYSPVVEKVGAIDGLYRVIVVATVGNGFEVGKSYNVDVEVYVGGAGIPMRSRIAEFVLMEYDLTDIGTTLAALNDLSAAQVNAEVGAALSEIGLDHLLKVAVTGADITNDSVIAKLVSKDVVADWDTFNNVTDSLEALGSSSVAAPTKEEIRIEMDANSTRLAAIDQNTSDTVALVLAT